MKRSNVKWLVCAAGVVLLGLGIFQLPGARATAIAEAASAGDQLQYALKLILILLGASMVLLPLFRRSGSTSATTRTLTLAAMFAALCYVGFTFFKIDIPVGSEKTAFHLGKCVLRAGGAVSGGLLGRYGRLRGHDHCRSHHRVHHSAPPRPSF